MKQFYSYLWLREDGTPYYAGKGTGKRAFVRGSHRLRPPTDRARILIFPMLSEVEAIESEIALIDLFGRKDKGTGCLRNFTDGGDGVSGYRVTEAAKQKASERLKGKHLSPMTEFKLGRACVRLGKTGYKETAEHRRKIGDAQKGHADYTHGVNIGNKYALGMVHTAEWKATRSAQQKQLWVERRAKRVAIS